jgi:hypothetical protein
MVADAVILAVSTLGAGLLALIARLAYSSKCALVKCCGCEIHRNKSQEQSVRNITSDIK